MSILDLKKEFKKRKLKLAHCIETTEDLADHMTVELLKRGNIDAALVALVSNALTMADQYKKRKFTIQLLSVALSTLESEDFREKGRKLS